LAGLGLLAACGAAPPPAPPPQDAAAIVTVPAAPAAAPEVRAPDARPAAAARARPPPGYVEMEVGAVTPSEQGQAVLLVDPSHKLLLPIFIGGSEALTIELRQQRRRYGRPLTHDLLDEIMRALGGEPIEVHVDELRQGTFVGSVLLRREGSDRPVRFDARPSDAIAMALGHRIPIFVAQSVLDEAGIKRDELPSGLPPAAPSGSAGPPPI
ncbi:MAG: bifunctional nuclease family protein, partial [Deltaproteobacteria bacterium]|nr:bifunctional nuclease family protein [Deltaproteobacteria bacterium]